VIDLSTPAPALAARNRATAIVGIAILASRDLWHRA